MVFASSLLVAQEYHGWERGSEVTMGLPPSQAKYLTSHPSWPFRPLTVRVGQGLEPTFRAGAKGAVGKF